MGSSSFLMRDIAAAHNHPLLSTSSAVVQGGGPVWTSVFHWVAYAVVMDSDSFEQPVMKQMGERELQELLTLAFPDMKYSFHSHYSSMASLKPPHLCRGNTWFTCSYIIHIRSLFEFHSCQRGFYGMRERVSQANWWCQILLNQQNSVLCSGLTLTSSCLQPSITSSYKHAGHPSKAHGREAEQLNGT